MQSKADLEKLESESLQQALPEQKQIFSIGKKFSRKKISHLPDPTNPPMGYEADKAYENVFPFVKLPFLHPNDQEDNISFGFGSAGYLDEVNKRHPLNAIYFGDNLQILRSLPSNSIDLIYIDPPFFSGRVYNQIWGDNNEVRTFNDIWDGGLPTYLIWLNARLWEMKRVLKQSGSIYVHCDWHASHHIKVEMDKIFGYDNFKNEVVWRYQTGGTPRDQWSKKHDVVFYYTKTQDWYFEPKEVLEPRGEEVLRRLARGTPGATRATNELRHPSDVWMINALNAMESERIGYPTQKPEALLERIIKASSNEGDVIADFFMGGGTTLAVAQKIGRKFIGSDISRVAVSVTLDRLVRDGEKISGQEASVSKREGPKQLAWAAKGKVSDIYVYYQGVYPVNKFERLNQDEFDEFILTCYGASKNTVADGVSGFKNQFNPILVGPVSKHVVLSIDAVRSFVQSVIKNHVQQNQRYTLTVLAWRFQPEVQEYKRQLQKTFFKQLQDKGLVLEMELIPIRNGKFRERIASHINIDKEERELLLQFVEAPLITEIVWRTATDKPLTYKFEVFAESVNTDGRLINCQWDFDYKDDNFSEPEFALNRIATKHGFEAILTAVKTFEKSGVYKVACKVQDNFGGEAIKVVDIDVK